MGAWIESHQSLRDHRKTLRVAERLHVDRFKLIGHLHCLWWWALDNVPSDGNLGDLSDREIAIAAGWTRQPSPFVNALTEAGFIDQGENGTRALHDWYDYAGKLMTRREANKTRMYQARALHVQRTEPAQDDHVRNTSAARAGATQPYPTVPNPTVPYEGTTTTAEAPDESLAVIARTYESEIGPISPTVAEELQELAARDPPGWFEAAVREAVNANVRKLSYVKSILERWRKEGFGARTTKARQGSARAGARGPTAGPDTQRWEDYKRGDG